MHWPYHLIDKNMQQGNDDLFFWSWNGISAGWREAVSVFRGGVIPPSSLVSDHHNANDDETARYVLVWWAIWRSFTHIGQLKIFNVHLLPFADKRVPEQCLKERAKASTPWFVPQIKTNLKMTFKQCMWLHFCDMLDSNLQLKITTLRYSSLYPI